MSFQQGTSVIRVKLVSGKYLGKSGLLDKGVGR